MMVIKNEINYKIIQNLETELASLPIRNNIKFLSKVLHDDFEEIGSSGRIYTKQDILNQLAINNNEYDLTNFSFKPLANDCLLVKYQSTSNSTKTLRTSIWINEKGNWQLLHHQGTMAE